MQSYGLPQVQGGAQQASPVVTDAGTTIPFNQPLRFLVEIGPFTTPTLWIGSSRKSQATQPGVGSWDMNCGVGMKGLCSCGYLVFDSTMQGPIGDEAVATREGTVSVVPNCLTLGSCPSLICPAGKIPLPGLPPSPGIILTIK